MTTFEEFITHYPSEVFEKGQTLLLRGDVPRAVHVIESGGVKSYTITGGGDERLVALNIKGEDLPVGFALGLVEESYYFYEAYTRCVIRLVPRKDYLEYLKSDVENMYRRHIHLATMLLATLSRVNALEQSRASDKIAFTLLYMAEQIGVKLRPQKTNLMLSVTQQEIANSLGLTRETTGIELKKLELKRLITHSRKSYVLYTERLRRYLDDRE
ncbi:MAG TPA: Crp/Fnr family transcriptional regulator [Candidatus Saccharimonadales bacterium]|nr:Crp/Fnr family transcriptional regulator [Candidatus Saccharimonadales bacterium]